MCLFFQTLSLAQIADGLALMGIPNVSKSTIFGALRAVAMEKFASRARYITKRLGDSAFLMADETPIRIGKKRGYAWIFIGTYGIKIVVSPTRGKIVLDLHCPYFHIPITVDGYSVYGSFETVQRCWAHILREAELLAARHGGSMSELHQRLQSMYHGAKSISPDISDDDLNGWINNTMGIADIYTELGYYSGEKMTCLMTWDDQGHDLSEKVYKTITAS